MTDADVTEAPHMAPATETAPTETAPTETATTIACSACGAPGCQPFGEKNGFALVRCPVCGSARVAEMPTLDFLAEYYRSYGSNAMYQKKKDAKVKRAARRIAFMRLFTRGKDFLDVGCNAGFAVHAARHQGFHATGIDLDAESIGLARDAYGEGFRVATIQEEAASGRRYDALYTSEVIEHTIDPLAFMRAVAMLLNPGGIVFLTTPDAGHRAVPEPFTAWPEVKPPRHLQFLTQDGMQALMTQAGLKPVIFVPMFKPTMRAIARKPRG